MLRAMTRSSSVGITQIGSSDSAASIRPSPAAFASRQLRAEATAADDLAPGLRISLPNPARENEPVQAAERGRQGTDLADDPIDKKVDRLACLGRIHARSVRMSDEDPGDAQQPRLLVQHVPQARASSAVFVHKIDDDLGSSEPQRPMHGRFFEP